MNEEPILESSLDLVLTQHLHDEDPNPREVRARLEVNPPWVWYYRISLNSCTLVILLLVDPASNDELETIYEGCYEIEDTFIFTWFSIIGIGHCCWLRGPICRLPPNSKVDYLVCTIRHIYISYSCELSLWHNLGLHM